MPSVTIAGWHAGQAPSSVPDSLRQLLKVEAGMDSGEIEAALAQLVRGKSVDANFDLAEEASAKSFIKKLAVFGLRAELQDDDKESWLGSPPRPRFLMCMFGGLLGFFIWFWSFLVQPQSAITKVLLALLICYFISLRIFPGILGRRHTTEIQEEWERKLSSRWGLALYMLVALTAAIVSEPWLGLLLVALAVAGAICALIIRKLNSSN